MNGQLLVNCLLILAGLAILALLVVSIAEDRPWEE